MSELEEIKITIRVRTCEDKIAKILFEAIQPENLLAPKGIGLENVINRNEIIFKCKIDFRRSTKMKIATIRRTIDDWIWSINTAYKSLRLLQRFDKND